MKHRFLAVLLALTMVLTLMPVGVVAEDDPVVNYMGLEFNKDTGTIEKSNSNSGSIEIPSQIEGVTVTKIAENAFAGAGITSVTIPNTIVEIGKNAFDGCKSLSTVIIQDTTDGTQGTMSIGMRAFAATSSLTTIVLPPRVEKIGALAFAESGLTTAVIEGAKSLESNVFLECKQLTTVIIPSISFSSNPFMGCGRLKTIHYLGSTLPTIPGLDPDAPDAIKLHGAQIVPDGKTEPVEHGQVGKNPEKAFCTDGTDYCGSLTNWTRYITEIPHDLVPIPDLAPTCTEAGHKGGYQCKICSKAIVPSEVIPATGHHFVKDTSQGTDGVVKKEPTCKETGYERTYMKCDNLGCTESYYDEEILELKVDHDYTKNTTVELGKGYLLKAATCEEAGLEIALRVCDVCEKTEIIDEKHLEEAHGEGKTCPVHTTRPIPKLQHVKGTSWTLDADVTQDYDCTTGSGEQEIAVIYQCTLCQKYPDELKDNIKVPAGQHAFGEETEVVDKPATCEEAGSAHKTKTCSVCGHVEDSKPYELPALGHTITEWKTTTEPTCSTAGVSTGKCEVCGNEQTKEIEKLPHTYPEEGTPIKEPTCTENGLEEFVCEKCGYKDQRETPLKGHTPAVPEKGTVLKAATCTDEGSMIYDTTCSVCHKDLQNTPVPIPAPGHDFGPWTTSGGVRTRTCQREGCGYKETNSSTTPTEPSDPSNPSTPDSSRTYYSVDVIRPANGTISVSTSSARPGTTVTVTLRPNSGYQLDSVQVTRGGSGRTVSLSGSGNNRYTFTMPSSRVEVRAVFSTASGTSTNTTAPNSSTANPTKNIVINIPQISSASTPAGSRVFVDVPSTFWASGEIAWACQQGYAGGSGGNFYPNNPMTVRQVWAVMARMMGQNPSSMEEARLWAINNGFASGGNPNAAVTRLQLATMLYRLARLMGSNNVNTTNLGVYTDSRNIPQASRNAMAWAVANGIITGSSDGKLNPNTTVSRAQFCVILYRYYQRLF